MSYVAKRSDKSVPVRFPPELIGPLDAAAARNGRSRNSEIIVRLAESLGLRGSGQQVSPPQGE